MLRTIANDKLIVTINETGAELWSIRADTEYLWQGDPAVWAGRSPTIFPYVARLFEGRYTVDGQPYRLPIHGFAGSMAFTPVQVQNDSITMELQSSKLTLALYPWPFVFRVRYALEGNQLNITYSVKNTGKTPMAFGLGGHPGFNVPLDNGLAFDDYVLRFDEPCAPEQVLFTPDCFVTGEKPAYPLRGGDTLPLKHELFDNDAIVLYGAAKGVTLLSPKGQRGVHVTCPQMPYLGFWHMPHTDAPYVCIEPWSSLPAKYGEITEFTDNPNLIHLDAGKTYENVWSIEILF
ncbi:MAG TPA: aldose 1-epimerase family protein [Candidatus Limiplasma sp.]|nr:aldose 1-epimerase family protein [Candidatus Limiplasma sp.]